jgi:hypothetical protein
MMVIAQAGNVAGVSQEEWATQFAAQVRSALDDVVRLVQTEVRALVA